MNCGTLRLPSADPDGNALALTAEVPRAGG
jgi:hypothetical protein